MKKTILNCLIMISLIICNFSFAKNTENCPPKNGPCDILAPKNVTLYIKANFDHAKPGASLNLMNYCTGGSVVLDKNNPETKETVSPSTIFIFLCHQNQIQDKEVLSLNNNTYLICEITDKITCTSK